MNMRNLLLTSLFLGLLVSAGCEKQELLQSEDKVKAQLNGRWKKVLSSSAESYEKWKLDNGTVTITKEFKDPDTTVVDHGSYSVTTKFSKSYITFSGLTSDKLEYWDLNRQWTIAELSGTVLYLSTTNSGGAIISREFVKD
jgi:hypothetical protein